MCNGCSVAGGYHVQLFDFKLRSREVRAMDNNDSLFQRYPIRQIAYFVSDIYEAARQHSKMFGTGPFFVSESVELSNSVYRGRPVNLDHSAAIAQWGEVMLEFNQQNDAGPSYFRDVYPAGSNRFGLHHVAIIVDDYAVGKQHCEKAGFEVIFETEANHVPYAMTDATGTLGHMVEIYPDLPMVRWAYETVRQSRGKFDDRSLFQQFPAPPGLF